MDDKPTYKPLNLNALQGFVISDWQGIDKITNPAHSNYTFSILSGVQAGIDMVR